MKHTESKIQIDTIARLRHEFKDLIIYAVENEGKKNIKQAMRSKAMGVLPGVADITVEFPGARVGHIEMKAPKGTQSINQKKFQIQCTKREIPYFLAYSVSDAVDCVKKMLDLFS